MFFRNPKLWCIALCLLTFPHEVFAEESRVNFAKEIQPLLRRHCQRCHGNSHQEGGLQLSNREQALGVADSAAPVIVPGNAEQSLLWERISNEDAGDLMPLDGEPLPQKERELIRKWINQGAHWPDIEKEIEHWAYSPIKRPKPPSHSKPDWLITPIDNFVAARLDEENLSPAATMPRAQWIRRVSLALTGLPPSPEQVNQFGADDSADAFEKVVDRLLASPRFGEKWAVPWLDLARYADSNGFQADQLRDSWAYRDWVIQAMNEDLPYDEFVIEQLAGDLLPEATFSQKVATGFHRTVTCNVEAGVHPEQNRVNQVFDRVNTTGTVFLGTTMECAQCHDHKYDPFSQTDYYRLFAYFNNTPLEVKNSSGVTWDFYGPTLDLPLNTEEQKQKKELSTELQQVKQKIAANMSAGEEAFARWESELKQTEAIEWQLLKVANFTATGGEDHRVLEDGSILVEGKVPETTTYEIVFEKLPEQLTAIKLEALTHEELPGTGPGRGDPVRRNFILSEIRAQVSRKGARELIPLTNPRADFSQKGWPVAAALDGDLKTGWAISPQFGQSHWAVFQTESTIRKSDSSKLTITLDQNYGTGRTLGRIRFSSYSREPSLLNIPEELRKLARKEKRETEETEKLRDHYFESQPEIKQLKKQQASLEKQLKVLEPPTTLVMVEMQDPRTTHVLDRGNYLTPLDEVSVGIPQPFQLDAAAYEPNRLGLARWMVSDENPLLARVAVNRWWIELFGRGLVTTPEDFGAQGEPPSHPELLDWLADELRTNGWSRKELLKQIVLSATFRQSSEVDSQLLAIDPDNVLYARGPRFRMTAELIRDNALAISGLLSPQMGGEPVMPFQPEGIWRSIGRNQPKWKVAQNEDRFRRGVYIVWKRDAPYPSLVSFDAPDRTACVVQRPKTNTPLQALTLLNDPAYGEMALALAARILTEPEKETDAARLTYGFQLAVAREPTIQEQQVLFSLLTAERDTLESEPALIDSRLKSALPGFPYQVEDKAEWAAWFAIANVLLNLDETITQP